MTSEIPPEILCTAKRKPFSIVMPVLNEELSIETCLTGLQEYRNQAEIIVVDGGSSDNTRALALPLADRVIPAERGRAKQMNAGAYYANGDILVFLHADTLLPANALTCINAHKGNQRLWGRFDIQLTGRHPIIKIVALSMNWRSRFTGISTGDQAIFVSKVLFDAVGGYPEIALMEDISLSQRLKRFASPVCLKEKVCSSARRWEQFGVFKTILLMWSLRLRFFFGADPAVLAKLYSEGKWWKT